MKRESKMLLFGLVMLGFAGVTVYVENREETPIHSDGNSATVAPAAIGIAAVDRLQPSTKARILQDPDFADFQRLDKVCAIYRSGEESCLERLRAGIGELESKWGCHMAISLTTREIESQIKKFQGPRYQESVWKFLDQVVVRGKEQWQEAMVKAMAVRGTKPLCRTSAFAHTTSVFTNQKQSDSAFSCLWHDTTFALNPFTTTPTGNFEKKAAPYLDLVCGPPENDPPVYSASLSLAIMVAQPDADEYSRIFTASMEGKQPVNDWVKCERRNGSKALLKLCNAIDTPRDVIGEMQALCLQDLLVATNLSGAELSRIAKEMVNNPAVLGTDESATADKPLMPMVMYKTSAAGREVYLFASTDSAQVANVTLAIEGVDLRIAERDSMPDQK